MPKASWTPLIAQMGYGVGFLIVILGRQQLFTENTLTVILPLMQKRTMHCLLQVMRVWVIVLPGSRLPERFSSEGVIPPVTRLPLPPPG